MAAHGTRTRYVTGCRCEDCTRANRDYNRAREMRVAHPDIYGEATDLIDAAPVREHLLALQHANVGTRTIAQVSGIGRTAIVQLRTGESRRVHRSTAAALFQVTTSARKAGALVDARETWEAIDCMREAGIPKARIAHAIGSKVPALQLSRNTVTQRNASAIADLHYRAWLGTPGMRERCEHFAERPEKRRDREYARKRRAAL